MANQKLWARKNRLIFMKINVIAVFCMLFIYPIDSVSNDASTIEYGSCVSPPTIGIDQIQLSGGLFSEEHWGPPTFGESPESDKKFTVWFVKLDKSVRVKYEKMTEGREIDLVQIYLLDSDIGDKVLRSLNKMHVVVKGKLVNKISPSDVGSVILNAEEIEKTPEKFGIRCRTLFNGN